MTLKLPNLTWRTKKRLKTSAIVIGSLVAVSFALWLCWILWLGRFVVYSREGVRLDFEWVTPGDYVAAQPPEEMPINIVFDDGSDTVVERSKELEKLTGSLVSLDLLTGDLDELNDAIRQQPKGTAILLELKSPTGSFLYKTSMPNATVSGDVDVEALDSLLKYLAKADYYTIASVPAFRDRAYGLKNTSYGIHHSSGRYLWAGDDRCYWLDPAKNGTRNWLMEIASELKDMGFDEVLFTDFCFPPTEDILYEGDKLAALNEAAEHLVYNLATDDFCVSFLCNEAGFRLPEGRARLYRSDVDASLAQSVASASGIADPTINLVFLSQVNDTRFDAYGVLRPLSTGMNQLPAATTPQTQEPLGPEEPVEPQEPAEPQEPVEPQEPAEPQEPVEP